MTHKRIGALPLLNFLVAAALCLALSGCFGSNSGSRKDRSGSAGEIEFPDGDPSVSAADGGPGFTGEGWATVNTGPLGDPKAVKGGTLRTYTPSWPDNLRFFGIRANTSFNYALRDLCFDSLCRINRHNLELVPSLASHWKISDDKLTFTFRINPKAHWSDGKPVTTDDVIATYDLLADTSLNDPVNREEIFGRLERPVAKSKYIFEVKCKQLDWRNFANIAVLNLLPAHEIAGISGTEFLDKYNYHYPVVSGAYRLRDEDLKTDHSITLTRRPDYWAINEPWAVGLNNFEKIRWDVILDEQQAFQAACKGDMDYYNVNVAKWWKEELPNVEGVKKGWIVRRKVYTEHPKNFQGYAINMRNPPLDDVRVREAIGHLYDRKTMVEKFAYNEYDLLKSYFPGGDGENHDNVLTDYNPRKAAELLEAAGWKERGPDGILIKDGKRLSTSLTYTSPVFEKYLTNLQQSCKQAGIEIKLVKLDDETQYANNQDRKFDISIQAWGFSLFSSPRGMFHSSMADAKGAENFAGVKDPQIDKWIDEYDAEFDRAKRNELLRKIDAAAFKIHPYIMNWTLTCERVIYWNKFGMPEYLMPKYAQWDHIYPYWWVDPTKEQELKKARAEGRSLEQLPIEVRPFDKARQATASASTVGG